MRTVVNILVAAFLVLAIRHADADAHIEIAIDGQFPRLVHEFFNSESIDEILLGNIAATAGAAALLGKTQTHTPDANMELLQEALRRAHGGEVWKEDPFYFWHTRRQREKTALLLEQIGDKSLARGVAARLQPYLPENFRLNTRIVLIVGGSSAGWTNGDGGFQVGLDHHAADPVAMIETTAAHEIYHLVQEKLLPPGPTDAENPYHRVTYLLYSLVQEGTASLLDDVDDLQGEGKLLDYLREKQKKNHARLASAFTLLDALVHRTAGDNGVDLGHLYEIGFLDSWGSPGYAVGRKMAEAIIAVDGNAAIPALLQAGPHAFVYRYAEISEKNPELPKFSQSFMAIVRASEPVMP